MPCQMRQVEVIVTSACEKGWGKGDFISRGDGCLKRERRFTSQQMQGSMRSTHIRNGGTGERRRQWRVGGQRCSWRTGKLHSNPTGSRCACQGPLHGVERTSDELLVPQVHSTLPGRSSRGPIHAAGMIGHSVRDRSQWQRLPSSAESCSLLGASGRRYDDACRLHQRAGQ
ncbi:hypothetical protein VUR80DRAFT_2628 [Thermomyces stellatus]